LTTAGGILIVDVPVADRAKLDWILEESFEGWYLRHSRKTLMEAELVRAATLWGAPIGLVMLKTVEDEAGYVYYIAVARASREKHVGSALLDDALRYFEGTGMKEVYASIETDNAASEGLFRSRGFVKTNFAEMSRRHGALHTLDMYRKMVVVPGEVLLTKNLGETQPA
jgi:ribosomal protein S18 acetylase RimI-like enzyme